MKNENVIINWKKGNKAKSKNLKTDGNFLFSYDLLIGYTMNNKKIVIDFTAYGNYFISMTTSCHVWRAKRYSDQVITVNKYFKLKKIQSILKGELC